MAALHSKALLATASAVLLAGGLMQGAGLASAGPNDGNATDPSASNQTPPPGAGTPDGTGGGPTSRAAGDCRLFTWPVAQQGSSLFVRGGRFDCGNYATYRVELRKARPFWPDATIGFADGAGNGSVVASSGCQGRAQYFGQTFSSTGNNFSGNRGDFC